MPPLPPRRPRHGPAQLQALRDDPVFAAVLLGALVSSILIALRHVAPESGAAEALGGQLAMLAGALGCAVTVAILSVTLTLPFLGLRNPVIEQFVSWGAPIFDEAATLAMALSSVAALGALVRMGYPGLPFVWFMIQGVLAWGCHRLRLRAIAP